MRVKRVYGSDSNLYLTSGLDSFLLDGNLFVLQESGRLYNVRRKSTETPLRTKFTSLIVFVLKEYILFSDAFPTLISEGKKKN